jgi:hypothetical protein
MKKIIAVFTLALLTIGVGAQVVSFNVGRKYAGYYVTLKGDTVKGFLRYGNNYEAQKKCNYYLNENDNEGAQSFKPEDIASYFVGDRLYRSIHYSGGLMEKPLRFNLCEKDGEIAQYTFYDEDGARNTDGSPKTTTLFLKAHDPANTKPVTVADLGIGYAKKMSAFIADDEELAKKVADKEKGYGMTKMFDVIDEYNTRYAARK